MILCVLEVFLVVLDTAESEVKSALEETDLSIAINYRQISSGDDWGTADSLRYISRDITVSLFWKLKQFHSSLGITFRNGNYYIMFLILKTIV